MKYLILLLLLILFSCQPSTNKTQITDVGETTFIDDNSYVWTKLSDSAEWNKSYNFQMFSIGDTLWTFHPDGCWYSSDGLNWTKSKLSNSINNLAFLDYVQFNDAVYGLGYFNGNIENFEFRSEFFQTTDFKSWKVLSKHSNLPKRFFTIPLSSTIKSG